MSSAATNTSSSSTRMRRSPWWWPTERDQHTGGVVRERRARDLRDGPVHGQDRGLNLRPGVQRVSVGVVAEEHGDGHAEGAGETLEFPREPGALPVHPEADRLAREPQNSGDLLLR